MLVQDYKGFRAMCSAMKHSKELTVDTETTGLRAFGGDSIIGIAVRTEDGQTWYAPFRHRRGKNLPEKWLKTLVPLLADPHKVYIGWNYKFDLTMLYREGIPLPVNVEDIMLAHHLYNENRQSYALKSLASLLLGEDSAAEQEDLKAKLKALGFKDAGSMCELPPEDVAAYAEKDVDLTWRMREWVKPRLESFAPQGVNQWGYFLEVCRFMRVCCKMEMQGLLVDRPKLDLYHQEAKDAVAPLLQQLKEIAGFDINPRSPKQVQVALFAKSADKNSVATILDKGPVHKGYNFAVVFQTYKEWVTVVSNYYEKYPGMIDLDGRIRTSYKLHGTVTGRMSAETPNLQQVKSWNESGPGKVKEVFIAPEGYEFLSVDYSQAELRMLAHYTQDANFLRAFAENEDLHQVVAEAMLVERKIAKNINFGATYGIGARALASFLRIPFKQAEAFLATYHRVNPGIRRLYGTCERIARTKGYIQLWTGRVRHFTGDHVAPYHKAMPHLIQGGAAELLRVSATRLERELDEGCPMVLQVHDQLMFCIKEGDAPKYVPTIVEVMTDFTQYITVPLKVDVSSGKNWGALRDYPLTTPAA